MLTGEGVLPAASYRRNRPRLTGEGRYPVIVSAKGGLFHWAPPRNESGVTIAGETSEVVTDSSIAAKMKHNSEQPVSVRDRRGGGAGILRW